MLNKIWNFSSATEVVFGLDAAKDIGQRAGKIQCRKVLVVTDQGIKQSGLLDLILGSLGASGVQYLVFDKTQPEPLVEQVYECRKILKDGNCDSVIGVGGGSAMDLAKAVALVSGNEGRFEDFVGIRKVPKKGLRVLLVPTTSGTGSEVSMFAVMTAGNAKAVVCDPLICADMAVVDPMMTVSAPRRITAYTGADALCHHIESFGSVKSSPLCEAITLEGIRCITTFLRPAFADGNNLEARYYMSYGSMLGGFAMNLTDGAAAIHGMAFSLGVKYHLPHGLANALMIPRTLEAVAPAMAGKIERIGEAMGLGMKGLSVKGKTAKVIESLEELLSDVGLPLHLAEVGAKPEDIELLTDGAMAQKRVMGQSPYKLTRDEVKAIFEKSM